MSGHVFRCTLVALLFWAGSVQAENLIALTADRHLIAFDSDNPGVLTGDLALTGFPQYTDQMSLDYRPATQTLVLFVQFTCCQGRLFDVNTTTEAISPRGAAFLLNPQQLTFDTREIDIDPVTDSLRVFGSIGFSYPEPNYGMTAGLFHGFFHVDPDSGARTPTDADTGTQMGAAGGPVTPTTVGSIAAGTLRYLYDIRGVAHSRNVDTAGQGTTTLYGILANDSTLVRIGSETGAPNPADSGNLETVGPLGFAVTLSGNSPNSSYSHGRGIPFEISALARAYIVTDDPAGTSGGTPAIWWAYDPALDWASLRTVDLNTGVASAPVHIGPGPRNIVGLAAAPGIVLGNPSGGGGGGSLAPLGLLGLFSVAALARWRKKARSG